MKNITKALAADGICKSFASKTVLNGVNAEFDYGTMTAIIGKSGSGKSTLLNIFGLLDNKYEGTLFIAGIKMNKRTDYALIRNKHIGFVFQSYYLIDYLSVADNISLPGLYSEKDLGPSRLNDVIDKLGIRDLLPQKASTLSGGEKQRVALARALYNSPDLLICDEPTGNLDPFNASIVLDELQSVKEDKAIIVVTHSEAVAARCDRVLHLRNGVIENE